MGISLTSVVSFAVLVVGLLTLYYARFAKPVFSVSILDKSIRKEVDNSYLIYFNIRMYSSIAIRVKMKLRINGKTLNARHHEGASQETREQRMEAGDSISLALWFPCTFDPSNKDCRLEIYDLGDHKVYPRHWKSLYEKLSCGSFKIPWEKQ